MKETDVNRLIVVTGPTATGKTQFAAHLASRVHAEIISADSRQVYRGMDLATGKDIEDYKVDGHIIPYHLVDILEPGYEYNVFEFQRDFLETYQSIRAREHNVLLCGGTGLYIESVLKGYKMIQVPDNQQLREKLSDYSMAKLQEVLLSFKVPHNITDTADRNRLIRAIEIQQYEMDHPGLDTSFPDFEAIIFAIRFDRQLIRERITARLKSRLDQGMAEEARVLLDKGLSPDQLKFYGLEYRYLTQYITGELSYEEMFRLLNTAIHQFAKRQMTWFRKMERNGIKIHWIDGLLPMDEKIDTALEVLRYNKIILDSPL